MANVSEIITLGIGTPSSIPYFVLTGLGIGAAPPGGFSATAVPAPRWPLSLHLYESMGGALIYTFPNPQGVTITDNEHGFESLTGFQEMLSHQAFWLYDLAPAKWVVLSCGGFTVWEGRLEDRKIQRGGFGFTAFGAKRYLDDTLYTALWSTKSFAGIRPVTADEVAKSTPERWAMDNNNRIWFGLVAGETYNNDDHYGMQVWRAPHNPSNAGIVEVEFTFLYSLPTDWQVRLVSYDEEFAGASVEYTFTSLGVGGGGSTIITLASPKQYITFQVRNNTGGNVTYAAETGTDYARITALRIKGTDSITLKANEIVGSMLVYSNNLSLNTALLQSPGVDLTDELFEDMRISEIITYLADKGDNQTPPRKWEWGVWEKQVLFFRPQGDAALHWYVDADELTLDSTLESLVNAVYGLYQDPNGRTLRTDINTDVNSVTRYGITRQGSVSERTTSQTKAELTRDTFLAQNKTIAPRASLTLYGLFDAAGARYPLWMARAGDTLTIRNLPPTLSSEIDKIRTFRISRKSYDIDTDILTPVPEYPIPTLEIMVSSALTTSGTPPPGFTGSGLGVGITPFFT